MLQPKAIFDAIGTQAVRLLSNSALPKAELEAQMKSLLQGAFNKLDLVSREEFDAQVAVLARTRSRLEALEAKVLELEQQLQSTK
ncbi:accessory factor UbiK family protein [Pseudomonas sp. F1_0610]|uniref:accessory factor UbiK family protein n=1 Tax=Pseudomonas sp. F1_0610 TaxID=3114284 RepID=UPI0039C3FCEA